MSRAEKKTVVASVLTRLRSTSRVSSAPFQQVLQQYAMERFLYRISKSEHSKSVILKGALLLKTIGIPRARPTMDIDLLRKGQTDPTSMLALVKDCATLEVDADGLSFLADTLVAEEIAKESRYKGTRILMDARMDKVRLRIRIDFGEDPLTDTFDKVVADLQFFIMPLLRSLARRDNLTQQWIAGTGWGVPLPL